MDEFRRDYYTFCQFDFQLDKIARVKSDEDYTDEVSEFFEDEEIFIENLFSFDWPDYLELYDIIAPPADIEIKTPGNVAGMNGRSAAKDGACEVKNGQLKCTCSIGLKFENGQCVDIDECSSSQSQCYKDEECYNYRGSFMCIEYPRHDSFTQDRDSIACTSNWVTPVTDRFCSEVCKPIEKDFLRKCILNLLRKCCKRFSEPSIGLFMS